MKSVVHDTMPQRDMAHTCIASLVVKNNYTRRSIQTMNRSIKMDKKEIKRLMKVWKRLYKHPPYMDATQWRADAKFIIENLQQKLEKLKKNDKIHDGRIEY